MFQFYFLFSFKDAKVTKRKQLMQDEWQGFLAFNLSLPPSPFFDG